MPPTTIVQVTHRDGDRVEFLNSAGSRVTAYRAGNASAAARHAAKLMLQGRRIPDDEIKDRLYRASGFVFVDGKISTLMMQPWSEYQTMIGRAVVATGGVRP